jgi:uncharacterized protein YjbI with pentapeptide repeats
MGARPATWQQQIKTHSVATVLIALLAIIITLIVLIILGYIFNWGWTGLGPYISPPHPKDSDFQRGKTLWDWLQLLIIPAVLAVAGYFINLTISRGEQEATKQRAQSEREAAEKRAETEREIAKQRYEQDQQIALDKQRQDLLQSYLDRMTELLLDKDLRSSQPDAEVRNVARARTLTVLPQLDAQRKGNLIQFLSESKLLEIISLKDVDLSEAHLSSVDLSFANLSRVNLCRVNLSDANLRRANLSRANLSYANLSFADLGDANLSGANLSFAELSGANLSFANLHGAELRDAILNNANLFVADLQGANLSRANLSGANLSRANLRDADLSRANLLDADLSVAKLGGALGITREKLEQQTVLLKGARMPNGSIHP